MDGGGESGAFFYITKKGIIKKGMPSANLIIVMTPSELSSKSTRTFGLKPTCSAPTLSPLDKIP